MDIISDEQAQRLGDKLIEVLQLKVKRSNGRVDTTWGDKTSIGLARTVLRIIKDEYLTIRQCVNIKDEYLTIRQCVKDGTHLTDCDDDGYCSYCGEQ